MFERRIEEAALNSWPALQQLLFDGWVIRFAQGYTKRANSVTPLYPSLLSAEEKIPVACGLAVLEHEACGIFDVVTDPGQRRKGYGTQLVAGMLAWGKQHAARYAYLQVVETNQAAQQMYASLGFQHHYSYWYRQRSLT